MKFNKFTHLSIIVFLSIVFIVIYLYYTISDVKKIHNEVRRLSSDIDKINQSLQNITSTIIPILQPTSDVCVNTNVNTNVNTTSSVVTKATCKDLPSLVGTTEPHNDDDNSSVDSQELKNIMSTIEDEEHNQDDVPNIDISSQVDNSSETKSVKNETVEQVAEQQESVKDYNKLTVDELKKLSYDTIRKYCKNNNIDHKGTKDVLIYRIQQEKML